MQQGYENMTMSIFTKLMEDPRLQMSGRTAWVVYQGMNEMFESQPTSVRDDLEDRYME
jgi:hypothetical protein